MLSRDPPEHHAAGDYQQSRRQSDVNEGRVMGASTVARLHADPGFKDDLEAAKLEYAVAVAKGLRPTRDCAAEAAALEIHAEPAVH